MDDPWQPQSDRGDVDLAVEAARWSLRQGRPGISPRLLQLLLETKFRNPMLGILGAHVLLLDARESLEQLDIVIGNLFNLVEGHPDVCALKWLLDEASGERRGRSEGGEMLSWPPMLVASYDAAIRRDAYQPGSIVDGSQAESLAAHLIVTGIWTTWRKSVESPSPRGARGAEPADEHDPALQRVLEYIDAAAERRAQSQDTLLATLDERECALGVGLPTAVVRRALTQLREERP